MGAGFACDVLVDGTSLGTVYGFSGKPDTSGSFMADSNGNLSPTVVGPPLAGLKFNTATFLDRLKGLTDGVTNYDKMGAVSVVFPAAILTGPTTAPVEATPTTKPVKIMLGESVFRLTDQFSQQRSEDYAFLDPTGNDNLSPFYQFMDSPSISALGPACSAWDRLVGLVCPDAANAASTKLGSVTIIEGGINGYMHSLMGAYSDMAASYDYPLSFVRAFNGFAVAFGCFRMLWRKAVSSMGMSNSEDIGIPGLSIVE